MSTENKLNDLETVRTKFNLSAPEILDHEFDIIAETGIASDILGSEDLTIGKRVHKCYSHKLLIIITVIFKIEKTKSPLQKVIANSDVWSCSCQISQTFHSGSFNTSYIHNLVHFL